MTLASLFALDDNEGPSIADRRSAPFWLAVFAFAMFLPAFFTLPPTDRDEPRFAQATKQMIQSGDYVDIRFQNEARNKKPIGVYWLQAISVRAGQAIGLPEALSTIWLYRLPSLAAAVAAVLLTFWTGTAFLARRAALLAAVLFGSTLLLGVEARLATTDAVLVATVVAAMGALARIYLVTNEQVLTTPHPFRDPFIFWTAVGLGVLVKGPITPMIAAAAIAVVCVHDHSAAWLRRLLPVPGLIWALAIAAPWLVLIVLRTHGAFLTDSLGRDMLGKVAGARESHGAPPGSYLVAFWLDGWPMAPFAALAAPFVWRHRARPRLVFLLGWLIPTWILFEFIPTKLPHYVLPLFPAIALLAAAAAEEAPIAIGGRWRAWTLRLVPAVALALVAATLALSYWRGQAPGWPATLAAPFVVWRSLVWLSEPGETGVAKRILEAALLSWLVYFCAYGGLAPLAAQTELSPLLVAARDRALAASGCSSISAATTSYREPSLVFLIGSELKLTDPQGAASFLAGAPCRIAFVAEKEEKAFAAMLPSAAGAPTFQRVRGLDLGHGRMTSVDVWTRGR